MARLSEFHRATGRRVSLSAGISEFVEAATKVNGRALYGPPRFCDGGPSDGGTMLNEASPGQAGRKPVVRDRRADVENKGLKVPC